MADEMRAEPTSGPWRAGARLERGNDGGKHTYIEITSAKTVFWLARVLSFDDDPGEYAANARLIAKAPELLEALKLCIITVESAPRLM